MLPLPRRLVENLLDRAVRIPLASIQRRMSLGEVARARRVPVRPGWCALFTKAFGIVAARQAVLRRSYIPFPRPTLYEHPENVAGISIERECAGGSGVLVARVRSPETWTLLEVEEELRRCKVVELTRVATFRRLLRLASMPSPYRRFIWWCGTQISGKLKSNHFGTFGVSPVSGEGAVSPHLLTPVTSALNYGVVDGDGAVDVYMTFDERVILPGPAERVMRELEEVLLDDICAELRVLKG